MKGCMRQKDGRSSKRRLPRKEAESYTRGKDGWTDGRARWKARGEERRDGERKTAVLRSCASAFKVCVCVCGESAPN